MGEVKSLKKELTDISDGVVKEVSSSAGEVKKTLDDTATELSGDVAKIRSTIQGKPEVAPAKESVEASEPDEQ